MKCPRCEWENLKGASFCNRCGADLSNLCPECGTQAQPIDIFCRTCGNALPGDGMDQSTRRPPTARMSTQTATLTMPQVTPTASTGAYSPPQEARGFPRWLLFAGGGLLVGGLCIIAIIALGYIGLSVDLFGARATPTPTTTAVAIPSEVAAIPSPSPSILPPDAPTSTPPVAPTEPPQPTLSIPAIPYHELAYDPNQWEYQQEGDLDRLVQRNDPTCILEFWWGRGLDFDLKQETTTEFAGISWTVTTYLREGEIILEQYTPLAAGREYDNPYGIYHYGLTPISSQCREASREVLSTYQVP